MAGSRSEWKTREKAQRKAVERRTREIAKLAKEKAREHQRSHQERQQAEAEQKSARITGRVQDLDQILLAAVRARPLTFDQLNAVDPGKRFDPGRLGVAEPAPDWETFTPAPPSGFRRVLGGRSRHERALREARGRFDSAKARHQKREKQRLRDLNAARIAHDRRAASAGIQAATDNAELDRLRADFDSGRPEAVEWFIGKVLERSAFPKGFPRLHRTAYRPEQRELVVEFALPPPSVVPDVRAYKYVKARDSIDPVPRPRNEVRQRYAKLLACVALRTVHEIFAATPGDLVEAVVFNGRLDATDPATGKKVRPHLVSVRAGRAAFERLDLADAQPVTCLKRLDAAVSPNPYDLEAVEPIVGLDLEQSSSGG